MSTPESSPLTHFDADGQAHMVDVGAKAETRRVAVATGRIHMLPATFDMVKSGSAKKGDVLGIARIAAIQASKRTSEDMCKAVDRGMRMEGIQLMEKLGGKSGHWKA